MVDHLTEPEQPFQGNPESGAELPADMGRFVSNLAYVVDSGISRVVAPYNLQPVDVHVLMICREMQECTATQLVRQMPVDAARVSRLVNTLVEKNYLRRRRRRDDRRVVMLRLSPQGETLIAEAEARLQEYYAQLTEGMSEQEIRAFATAAMHILANYEQLNRPT